MNLFKSVRFDFLSRLFLQKPYILPSFKNLLITVHDNDDSDDDTTERFALKTNLEAPSRKISSPCAEQSRIPETTGRYPNGTR